MSSLVRLKDSFRVGVAKGYILEFTASTSNLRVTQGKALGIGGELIEYATQTSQPQQTIWKHRRDTALT